MAKRKAARASATASAKRRKKARKVTARRKASARPARRTSKARLRKASARRARKASAGRVRKASAARTRKASAARTRKASAGPARTPARKPARAKRMAPRTAPALNRERRTIGDEGIVPSPPSSLDLDRTASAARSGRRELHEKLTKHTETSPAITGGDIDADWESAYSTGDEAPGGDNPTPDQDIVDDIGRAVGVEYEDNEELKGEKKISDRDRKRWELDPASAEDFEEH